MDLWTVMCLANAGYCCYLAVLAVGFVIYLHFLYMPESHSEAGLPDNLCKVLTSYN